MNIFYLSKKKKRIFSIRNPFWPWWKTIKRKFWQSLHVYHIWMKKHGTCQSSYVLGLQGPTYALIIRNYQSSLVDHVGVKKKNLISRNGKHLSSISIVLILKIRLTWPVQNQHVLQEQAPFRLSIHFSNHKARKTSKMHLIWVSWIKQRWVPHKRWWQNGISIQHRIVSHFMSLTRNNILVICGANLRPSVLPKMAASSPQVSLTKCIYFSTILQLAIWIFPTHINRWFQKSWNHGNERRNQVVNKVPVDILTNWREFEWNTNTGPEYPWKLVPVVNKFRNNIVPLKISYSCQWVAIIVVLSKCFLVHLLRDLNEGRQMPSLFNQ